MIQAILSLFIAVLGTLLGVFWKRNQDHRKEQRERVDAWRRESQRQHDDRRKTVDEATAVTRREVERLDESRASRQALADLLNEE